MVLWKAEESTLEMKLFIPFNGPKKEFPLFMLRVPELFPLMKKLAEIAD